ncbi:L-threonylcarbamoyladenylate synthase [Rheinheimera pacifica]|uniref:tRNA threonylcarbamoyl adenosine modification protein, Sua5/YciO/YrdC/YwlC family n=1 Tax=Rheinheimera pacifica TaxID=173990 RepID=A0A1H6MMS3_9GAMM|nr:L-threonylcarbamoyladenylate synthase [Rheinheimera pacifica]MDR6984699.1 tRNA threonylcarbamoyl adenosine modification protein (Sua5/YciO/YrdC/YwlC family) [Rheinheimera pacifica]SEI03113.1 tRNA threonylcarbamoyl adenosine modification protein, Sua5/YciO/YrdC/YwlC family [Rheinheimera pacifica]
MSQFFHIHPETPQLRLLKQAVQIIRQGGVVIYPTDSGYALGCHVGDKNAMERILQIRQVNVDHNFTLLCRDLSELSVYAKVENSAFRLIKNNTPGAYTFILRGTKEVPKRLLNEKKKTIGLRIPENKIAQALLEELGEPLLSTSLILPGEEFAESDPEEMRARLEKQVDLILHGGVIGEAPTTVIDLSDDEPVLLREGRGDPTPFR